MSAPLTPAEIATVKSTAPLLQQHGETITASFYADLIGTHPELRSIFSSTAQATGRQARALAGAVLAYAGHVDDLPALAAAVERIAHKHASLMVRPSQYALVGTHLLAAIDREVSKVLGAPVPKDILAAWEKAYTALAGVFIASEQRLYATQREDGWWESEDGKVHTKTNGNAAATTPVDDEAAYEHGWRRFRIVRKTSETSSITSFYLVPVQPLSGGRGLPAFLPGQYVSVRIHVPGLGHLQSRQFSLSAASRRGESYYRISVKREDEDAAARLPAGIVTNLLHAQYSVGDEVGVSHPQGEFFCDPADTSKEGAPAVLLAAGVGATPLLAILESLAPLGTEKGAGGGTNGESSTKTVKRPVSWIQAARSKAERPFAEEVERICEANNNVTARVFLKTVMEGDKEGVDYHVCGTRMDLAKVDAQRDLHLDNPSAEYFVCGPVEFMLHVRKTLFGLGVEKDRVYLELFETGNVPDE